MIQISKKMAIVLGVLIIAVIVILVTFIKRPKPGIDYKELIKAKDETIQVLQEQRPIFEKHIEELKGVISDHKRNDSLLIVQINSTKQSIRQVDDKFKNIPIRISRIAGNNDSLRAAISNL